VLIGWGDTRRRVPNSAPGLYIDCITSTVNMVLIQIFYDFIIKISILKKPLSRNEFICDITLITAIYNMLKSLSFMQIF